MLCRLMGHVWAGTFCPAGQARMCRRCATVEFKTWAMSASSGARVEVDYATDASGWVTGTPTVFITEDRTGA